MWLGPLVLCWALLMRWCYAKPLRKGFGRVVFRETTEEGGVQRSSDVFTGLLVIGGFNIGRWLLEILSSSKCWIGRGCDIPFI